jgi:hypothetical protein
MRIIADPLIHQGHFAHTKRGSPMEIMRQSIAMPKLHSHYGVDINSHDHADGASDLQQTGSGIAESS